MQLIVKGDGELGIVVPKNVDWEGLVPICKHGGITLILDEEVAPGGPMWKVKT